VAKKKTASFIDYFWSGFYGSFGALLVVEPVS
jgi:hypothetical protein